MLADKIWVASFKIPLLLCFINAFLCKGRNLMQFTAFSNTSTILFKDINIHSKHMQRLLTVSAWK